MVPIATRNYGLRELVFRRGHCDAIFGAHQCYVKRGQRGFVQYNVYHGVVVIKYGPWRGVASAAPCGVHIGTIFYGKVCGVFGS